ncbi:MAG: hypothetical protein JWO67_935 [Streptosporangiaceae bacterium]|nr:hypothetical protein [Streptosporangiaceae bacterium]
MTLILVGGPVLLAAVGCLIAGGAIGTVDPEQTITMPIVTADLLSQRLPASPDPSAADELRTALRSARTTLATARHRAPARPRGGWARDAWKAITRSGGTRRAAPDRRRAKAERPAEQTAGGEK